jgi:hypothetical protein
VAEDAIARAAQFTRLDGLFERPSAPAPSSCLVVSLYDERNRPRLVEYLACLVANLDAFERIIICYESTNGVLASIVGEIVALLETSPDRLHLLPCASRPTFEELFGAGALLPDGTTVAVANADIAFDASFLRIGSLDLSRSIVVLTRYDISRDGRTALLIHWDNGAPNTLSADAWIFRTPFASDFNLDYPIGTFYCDSFINNQISKSSRYDAINPCFDVRAFHLHDDRFNSSAAKQADTRGIDTRHQDEWERNGRANPIKGVAWSSLESAHLVSAPLRYREWKNRALIFELEGLSKPSSAGLLLIHYLLTCKPRLLEDSVLVARLPHADLRAAPGAALARYQTYFSISSLSLDVLGGEREVATSAQAATVNKVELNRLAWHLIEKSPDDDLNGLLWPGFAQGSLMRTEMVGAFSAETATTFRRYLQQETDAVTAVRRFVESLPDRSAERSALAPFLAPPAD